MLMVMVEWIDCVYSTGVFSPSELGDFKLVTIKTIGYGIEKENRWILAKEKFISEGNYRHITAIPKVGIIKVTMLEEKNGK